MNLRNLLGIGALASLLNLAEAKDESIKERVFYSQIKRIKNDYTVFSPEGIIRYALTPNDVQAYLDHHFTPNNFERTESFVENHKDKTGNTFDYAMAAAALLSDNGYTSNVLLLKRKNLRSEAVFIYKTDKGFGALGQTPLRAIFPTLDTLIINLNQRYNKDYISYSLIDINQTYPNKEWMNSKEVLKPLRDKNLTKIKRILPLKDSEFKLRPLHESEIKIIKPNSNKKSKINYFTFYKKISWKKSIEIVHTTEEAQKYLYQRFRYQHGEGVANSFAINHKDRRGDCNEYAMAAAALLYDDGFTPNLLFTSRYGLDFSHAVFVYKTDKGFGALGNTPIEPKYSSINDLVLALNHRYRFIFNRYKLIDLVATFPNNEWIDSDNNLEAFDPTMFFPSRRVIENL
ncbi:MAG: hypothetical protein Q8Q35_01820 [Nanoarchaeota archaeon]|nr:hypothetical protein [Nanoarchaeota archaeon]